MAAPKHATYAGSVPQSRVLFLNELVRELCSIKGFELLDLTEPMPDDYQVNQVPFNSPWDGHWNQYGHEFVSRQVLALARIIHKPCREVAKMPVMARKTSEPTGGVFERHAEDRRVRMTPPALADTTPQQRACE